MLNETNAVEAVDSSTEIVESRQDEEITDREMLVEIYKVTRKNATILSKIDKRIEKLERHVYGKKNKYIASTSTTSTLTQPNINRKQTNY